MAVLSASTDIKSLIESHSAIQYSGRAVKVHGIVEYHSNCPWCGGNDRFIIRPGEGTYSCATRSSGCDRFGDMITFLREYCDMSFREACEEIGVEPDELGDYTSTSSPSAQVYGPPNKTWQERGEQMVAKAQAVLRSPMGKDALEYLRARGLTNDTILDKRLGYIPLGPDGRWHSSSLDEWGLTAEGTGKDRVWQPEGILIPWYVNGKLWKLDTRRLTGIKKDDPKIISITGSTDCLYNHDTVQGGKAAVICESALCAISGEQEAGDLAAFVATGGSGKHRPVWVRHLEQATLTIIGLDLDDLDGNEKRAGDEGAVYWEKSLTCQIRWHPYQKDINDMLVAGDSIRGWVEQGIGFYYDLEAARDAPMSTPEPVIIDPITEEIPVGTEPTSWDDLIPDGYNVCSVCLGLGIDTPASHELDGDMYCLEHYPPLKGLNPLIITSQLCEPSFQDAKIEFWRVEDGKRMRESILNRYRAAEPQAPVSQSPSSSLLFDLIGELEKAGRLPEPKSIVYPDYWQSLPRRLKTSLSRLG